MPADRDPSTVGGVYAAIMSLPEEERAATTNLVSYSQDAERALTMPADRDPSTVGGVYAAIMSLPEEERAAAFHAATSAAAAFSSNKA
jgi:hypothetical protein